MRGPRRGQEVLDTEGVDRPVARVCESNEVGPPASKRSGMVTCRKRAFIRCKVQTLPLMIDLHDEIIEGDSSERGRGKKRNVTTIGPNHLVGIGQPT